MPRQGDTNDKDVDLSTNFCNPRLFISSTCGMEVGEEISVKGGSVTVTGGDEICVGVMVGVHTGGKPYKGFEGWYPCCVGVGVTVFGKVEMLSTS
jgi:hypothetical protein